MPRADQLDAATLLITCGGDPLLLQKLIDSFQRTVDDHLANLRSAARQGDADRLRQAAHKLRGLVSAFSPRIAASLASLEEGTNDEQPPGVLVTQCDNVCDAIAVLREALAKTSVQDLKRWIA